ncbi:hypothetical protein GH984_05040 [Spiribacter sp. C176]|uniref:Uncharacterized protein n=1 Tax=Spiribacter salilacus TaxID=2664894 RepID=A0A6N7QNR3_9GAMM|nr:hypothetical protein [Spiribacter salilacus]MRH78066.1 hypothetical protein [Spiribacter salilacus]
MARGRESRDARMRERLTQEAARIMAVEGVRDFSQAKRKAAAHLGAPSTTNLPQNKEIQAALVEYQRLFGGEEQAQALHALRQMALEAMDFFAAFRPRLVGEVLEGTAAEGAPIELHCFADTPEDVVFFLMDQGIPFDTDQRRLRFDTDPVTLPCHRFLAGDAEVQLVVMDPKGLRQPPRSPIDGRPMRRASRSQLAEMLN